MAAEPADIPPMPKVTATVFVVCATAFLFGLGLAIGGDELHKIGLQPGILLIVCALVLAIFTGLIHVTYCYGWHQRGQKTMAPAILGASLRTGTAADVGERQFVVDGTKAPNESGTRVRSGSDSSDRYPSFVTIVRLAQGLGVDPGMLVKGSRS